MEVHVLPVPERLVLAVGGVPGARDDFPGEAGLGGALAVLPEEEPVFSKTFFALVGNFANFERPILCCIEADVCR